MEGFGCGKGGLFGGEEEGGIVEAEGRLGGDGLYGLFVPRCLFIVKSLGKLWTVGMETSMNVINRLTSGLIEPCQQRNLHPLCRKRTCKLGIQLRSSYRSQEPAAME